jgi:hypothetical protein
MPQQEIAGKLTSPEVIAPREPDTDRSMTGKED